MASFISPLPTLSHQQQQVTINNCPLRKAVSRRTRHESSTRRTIVARVRRGARPDPKLPNFLHEAEPMYDIDVKPFDFSKLEGKVVLVVNVASDDEQFTDTTYSMLSKLLDMYHEVGFEVVAFPSNWFGQLETRSFEEIKEFVYSNYSNKIHLMAKTDLDWNPVLALGKKYLPGEIIWNFHGKFLFGKKGLPVARYDLLTTFEYIDQQLNHFLYSKDPSIHDAVAPARDSEEDEKDYTFFKGREGYEAEEEEEEEDDEDESEEKVRVRNQEAEDEDDDDGIEREVVEEEEEVSVDNEDDLEDVDAEVGEEIVSEDMDDEDDDDDDLDEDSEMNVNDDDDVDEELVAAPKKGKSRKKT